MELGQIHMHTQFGEALYKLIASDCTIQRVVDVGAWNGMGTTLIVIHAMYKRGKILTCLSLESNFQMWRKAVQNWFGRVPPDNSLQIIYGRFGEGMMSRDEIKRHPLFPKIQDHYRLYYDQDKADYAKCKQIVVDRAELVILDGGEFCGQGDLEAALQMKPKYIALDDIFVIKNYDNYYRLKEDGWTIVFESKERNGSCIFRR